MNNVNVIGQVEGASAGVTRPAEASGGGEGGLFAALLGATGRTAALAAASSEAAGTAEGAQPAANGTAPSLFSSLFHLLVASEGNLQQASDGDPATALLAAEAQTEQAATPLLAGPMADGGDVLALSMSAGLARTMPTTQPVPVANDNTDPDVSSGDEATMPTEAMTMAIAAMPQPAPLGTPPEAMAAPLPGAAPQALTPPEAGLSAPAPAIAPAAGAGDEATPIPAPGSQPAVAGEASSGQASPGEPSSGEAPPDSTASGDTPETAETAETAAGAANPAVSAPAAPIAAVAPASLAEAAATVTGGKGAADTLVRPSSNRTGEAAPRRDGAETASGSARTAAAAGSADITAVVSDAAASDNSDAGDGEPQNPRLAADFATPINKGAQTADAPLEAFFPAQGPSTPQAAANTVRPAEGLAMPTGANPASVPVGQLAVHIASQSQAGKHQFDIRLNPPELGRVDIRMQIDADGSTLTHLAVEKPETLDLLQRDSRQLERALQNAGLDARDGSLSFSLRDDQRGRQWQQPAQQTPAYGGSNTSEETVEPAAVIHRTMSTSGNLDISI